MKPARRRHRPRHYLRYKRRRSCKRHGAFSTDDRLLGYRPCSFGHNQQDRGRKRQKKCLGSVEPSVPLRQLKYYYSIKPFDNLGVIIYGDETISGVPDIRKSAAQNGFSLTKYNIEEQPRETAEELAAYYDLVEKQIKKIVKEDIDAFFLTIDLVNDYDQLPRMLKPSATKASRYI